MKTLKQVFIQLCCFFLLLTTAAPAQEKKEKDSDVTVTVTPLFWLANVSGAGLKRTDTYINPHFGAQVAVAYKRYSLVGQLVTAGVDGRGEEIDSHTRRYDGDLIAGYTLSPSWNGHLHTTLGLGYKFVYANSDFDDSRSESQTNRFHFATFNTGFLYQHDQTSTWFPTFNLALLVGHTSLSNPDPNERRSGAVIGLVPDVGIRWQANPNVTLLLSYKTQWITFAQKTGKEDGHILIHGPQIGLIARLSPDGSVVQQPVKDSDVTVTVTPLFWLANVSGAGLKRTDTYINPHFGAQVAAAYKRYSLVGQLVTAGIDGRGEEIDSHTRRYDGDLIAGYTLSPSWNGHLHTTLGLGYKFVYANSDFDDSRNESQTNRFHFATFNTGFLYQHDQTSTWFPTFNLALLVGHTSLSNPDPNERRSGAVIGLVPDVGIRWQANPNVTLLLSYKTQWITFAQKTGKEDGHILIHGPQIGLIARF